MPTASSADLRSAQRVLCHGVTGSGKSTAATRLGEVLGLPVHLVDDEIGWLPEWTQRPADEQQQRAAALAETEQWVVDSAYRSWSDVILARAQVIVALDYSRPLTLGRLLRRTAARILRRDRVCNGNTETLARALGPESILLWHHRSFHRKRARLRTWQAAADGPAVLRLARPADLDRLVDELAARR